MVADDGERILSQERDAERIRKKDRNQKSEGERLNSGVQTLPLRF
jgi:hypothetical protein